MNLGSNEQNVPMVATLEPPVVEPGDRPPVTRRPRRLVAVLVIAIVVALAGGLVAHEWDQAGTRIGVENGNVLGTARLPVGEPLSVGIPLTTSGGRAVTLQSVRADHSPTVRVQYAIVHTAPGALGFGSTVGSIAAWNPVPVRGARIAQAGPADGATWLVVTVVPRHAGQWLVTKFTLSYRSWVRNRSVGSAFIFRGSAD